MISNGLQPWHLILLAPIAMVVGAIAIALYRTRD